MTEEEWLDEDAYVGEMLDWLKETDRAAPRKLRLYACVWGRLMWEAYGHKTHKRVVELAEDYADGLITSEELSAAVEIAVEYREAYETTEDQASVCPGRVAFATADADAASAAWDAYYHGSDVYEYLRYAPIPDLPDGASVRMLREIVGNPFRPSTVDPAWLTYHDGAVAKLARSAYDERNLPYGTLDLERLAVLADALEEAGCADRAVLDHLRDKTDHYRGCWVVDLILEQTGGFAAPPKKGRKKTKQNEGRVLHTVEDILKAAALLTPTEIVRLKEGLGRLEEQQESQPPKAKRRKK